MIEVVFGDSAGGSLKEAQHCGEGEYQSGVIGVVITQRDGSGPTEEEIEAAQREYEERERLEWENATPIGGNPEDIYGFDFRLSIGDISENVPGEKRGKVLKWFFGIYPEPEEVLAFIEEFIQRVEKDLKEIYCRISAGEVIRIWYSNQPDELCGMYWFMAQLNEVELQDNQVVLAQLPDWEINEGGNMVIHSGWGDVKLGDWHRHLELQKVAPPAFRKQCANHWERLQQENAPLRAVLNGRLVSAPETLYDEFITREIAAMENEFDEVMLIGRILGKYGLGIGDTWLAQRIESMISTGSLIPVTKPEPDCPIYHKKLTKV